MVFFSRRKRNLLTINDNKRPDFLRALWVPGMVSAAAQHLALMVPDKPGGPDLTGQNRLRECYLPKFSQLIVVALG